jgi:glycosyltransferase involved in cell wall biosynthesis
VRIISNGLDLELFKRREVLEDVFGGYGIDPAVPRVLTVGRVEKEKRVDVLIEAISRMHKGSAQLIIVGKGKEEAALKKLAKERGILNRCVFIGAMPNNELYKFYCTSDIYISASEVELQGLSIMEAMAYGLPIVAANSMAIPELVRDQVNGLLFTPGDARDARKKIEALINDAPLRNKMASASLRLIQDHNFEKTLDAFEEVYDLAKKQ